MISCIILDDEPLAIKVIENFVKKIDFLVCVGTFSNANDALTTIKKKKVDLMFLDINMPFVDGISFLKNLETSSKNNYYKCSFRLCSRRIRFKCS